MSEEAQTEKTRRENAERIADVMSSERGHTYRHRIEDGTIKPGESDKLRRLTLETLNDPKTQAIKIKREDGTIEYRFYNPERNWMVIIDQDAKDWGTAYAPDSKERARNLMTVPGHPIQENGKVSFLERMKLGFFSNQSRYNEVVRERTQQTDIPTHTHTPANTNPQPPPPHGTGRIARVIAAAGIIGTILSAHDEARAATTTGAAITAAGRELAMGLVPFAPAAAAASQGRTAEAAMSFLGDCTWLGMGASEALRPMLRAMGADVDPGMIESALLNSRRKNEDPKKFAMMNMVRDIPAMSPEDAKGKGVPFGPVYEVAVKKFEIQQEVEKVKTLMKGRNLEDLSPDEQKKYADSLWRIQNKSREITNVWSKEVENKLGPSQNYAGKDPVQNLRDQIKENLHRGTKEQFSLSSYKQYTEDGQGLLPTEILSIKESFNSTGLTIPQDAQSSQMGRSNILDGNQPNPSPSAQQLSESFGINLPTQPPSLAKRSDELLEEPSTNPTPRNLASIKSLKMEF